ncbi:glycoside hydrolase family 3 C-terminal domain-containing protein [Aeromonas bivalvium]|uniref:glycoside hydrolase family 3 C-terminal domain-containing protein n=1 Tax=Aeromonas bivalvium TaxID=440079 RepID=UPI0038D16FD6
MMRKGVCKVAKIRMRLTTMAVVISAVTGGIAGCNNSNNSDGNNDGGEAVTNPLEEQARSLLSKMTADEKLHMIIGPGFGNPAVNDKAPVAGTVGFINGVLNNESGLDIAATKLMDGPAGIRITPTRAGDSNTYYATNFPSGTVLASTWNTELVQDVGIAAGKEGKEYGVDIWLAPAMNIQRNPLSGRNFEYFSEDPLISGMMGAAIVNGAQSQGIGTTIKHFVANNSETNRRTSNTVITPRALREIYLRGFQYTIEKSQPWAVMSSYNSVNGTNVGERSDLMTTIARDEWGFDGLMMSDWWAGWDPVAMLKAGVDVIEPGGQWRFGHSDDWFPFIEAAYQNGELTDEVLDTNVVRILKQALKTPSAKGEAFNSTPDLAANAAVALQAAEEGIVMLKNETALPLATTNTIAAFGTAQYGTLPVGGGSGSVNAAHIISINEGLKASGYTLNAALDTIYQNAYNSRTLEGSSSTNPEKYCDGGTSAGETNLGGLFAVCRELTLTDDQIVQAAASSDVAVITIARNTAEGADNPERVTTTTNPRSAGYYLNPVEKDLIERVSTRFHAENKKVVVVLNIGNVMDTVEWRDSVDGILVAYLPGQEAGAAVANIISGAVNPSGKLAQTFPMDLTKVSSYSADGGSFPGIYEDNYYNEGPSDVPGLNYDEQVVANNDHRDFNQYYSDDIYVGYRYNTTFNIDVAYPFGYGLSYTTFDFSNSTVTSNTLNSEGAKGSVTITTTVQNTGSRAGKQVAQVYITAPEVKLAKPTIELKSFAKTELLEAGGKQDVSMTIPAETLASFDPSSNQWIIEPGRYTVFVSASSNVYGVTPVKFQVNQEIVVSKTTPGTVAVQDEYADALNSRLLSR